MTALVIPFVGRSERTARENLASLIEHSKGARFFIGPNAQEWSASTWDLTAFLPQPGRKPVMAHFTTLETTRSGNRSPTAEEFPEPFLGAAKAITIEFLRTTATRSPAQPLAALRLIEKAFRDMAIEPDICNLSPAVLDRAQSLAIERYTTPWTKGRHLERIANEFVNPARIVSIPVFWKTSIQFKKPKRNDEVNKSGGAAGNTARLPHLKAILDLSGVFYSSKKPEDVVITSWFALTMFAPSRVNEVLSLPLDCATQMNGAFGVSWRPLKGGQPKTNFGVTEEWELVALEAIERLAILGETSRTAAKWYEENPDQLYLPPGMERLRGQPITLWEAAQILGRTKPLSSGSQPERALERVGITTDVERARPNIKAGTTKVFSFASLERFVLASLPNGWPYIDERHGLKASEALFCLPANILRAYADTERYMPTFISLDQISHELGSKPGGKTIFARHGLINPKTGLAWSITTHQPRHLLNTLAQSKHLSQELIAFWSGRKSVRQNDYYDHMPQEFYLEEWLLFDEQASRQIDVVGPLEHKLEERSRREIISKEDALRLELGSMITTRFGLCRHDFSLTGCPRDKDCINCGENTFVKGVEEHLCEARAQLDLNIKAAQTAREAVSLGRRGAERWLGRHEEKAARWQLAVNSLTNPNIAEGTLITLPPVEHPQSKTGLADEIRKVEALEEPSASTVPDLEFFDDLWRGEEDG